MAAMLRLQEDLEMLVWNSCCSSRAGGRLKADLRLSPPAFFFRWMEMAVAARASTQLGLVVSGTSRGSVSSYILGV